MGKQRPVAAALGRWTEGRSCLVPCVSVEMERERQAQSTVALTSRIEQLQAVVPFAVIGANGEEELGLGKVLELHVGSEIRCSAYNQAWVYQAGVCIRSLRSENLGLRLNVINI